MVKKFQKQETSEPLALPPLAGLPIRVEIRRSLGPYLAASSIPSRLILLDAQVLQSHGEFERILIHEIFHFIWVRLSNRKRRSWEMILVAEFDAQTPGELGWSAEWRKQKIVRGDIAPRTSGWRRYACESFCDSAAWLFSGLPSHDEFTLASRPRRLRRAWFGTNFPKDGVIPL